MRASKALSSNGMRYGSGEMRRNVPCSYIERQESPCEYWTISHPRASNPMRLMSATCSPAPHPKSRTEALVGNCPATSWMMASPWLTFASIGLLLLTPSVLSNPAVRVSSSPYTGVCACRSCPLTDERRLEKPCRRTAFARSVAAGYALRRVRDSARARGRRFRRRLSCERLLARAPGRAEGVHAGLARGAGRGAEDHDPLQGSREDLRDGPALVRQRSTAAREVRPPVAGQGLSLLGRQRDRLHGDALPAGHHAARQAQDDGRAAERSLAPSDPRSDARSAGAA